MTRLLLKKYFHESGLLLLACATMVLVFCWVRIWIISQFELQRFEVFLDQLRAFERFLPVPLEQVLTYTGSIALTFDEPVLIFCVVVWSISRGSDVVSGELGRGTLEMLLAQPISRLRMLACHAAVSVFGIAVLCSLAWLGLKLGIDTNRVKESVTNGVTWNIPLLNLPISLGQSEIVLVPLAQRVDASVFLPATLNLFSLGFYLLGLSVLCSCADRYRWRVIGMVVGFYVVQLLIYLLGKASAATQIFLYGTFFSLYQPDAIVHFVSQHPQATWCVTSFDERLGVLGPLGFSLALICLGLACYAAAAIIFVRRDLPAPL